jgi:hypothetical protein
MRDMFYFEDKLRCRREERNHQCLKTTKHDIRSYTEYTTKFKTSRQHSRQIPSLAQNDILSMRLYARFGLFETLTSQYNANAPMIFTTLYVHMIPMANQFPAMLEHRPCLTLDTAGIGAVHQDSRDLHQRTGDSLRCIGAQGLRWWRVEGEDLGGGADDGDTDSAGRHDGAEQVAYEADVVHECPEAEHGR